MQKFLRSFLFLSLALAQFYLVSAPPVFAQATPVTNPKLPPLKPRPGYFIGRCVDMRGKPLGGVGIRVSGTTQNQGQRTMYETRTNATGFYSIKLPAGNFRLGWAHYYTAAPSGPPYALPLHPLDGHNNDQNSARGIVKDCVLKINGRISPRNDPENDLSYYGGYITVEGGALENGHFLTGYTYTFPEGSAVELVLTPQGKLADGSTSGQIVRRRPVERGFIAAFRDVPIGAYTVQARLIGANGAISPLRVAAAKPLSGTSPAYQTPTSTDFKGSARIYFPSRGDSIPVLTYGGVAKAPLYVQP